MTSSPRRAFRALSWLNHTVDTLFQLAIKDGDSLKKHHASFSYYTQRTALASVLTSSDLLLVQDSSVNCRDTKNYIQDRLQNLNSLEYQFLQVSLFVATYIYALYFPFLLLDR